MGVSRLARNKHPLFSHRKVRFLPTMCAPTASKIITCMCCALWNEKILNLKPGTYEISHNVIGSSLLPSKTTSTFPIYSTLCLVPSLVVTARWSEGRGVHAIHFACIVRHMARCTTVTYPNIATVVLRLCCECAGQVITRDWSRHTSRISPSWAIGHNTTRRYRFAWGIELDHHSPVGR